MAVKPVTVTLSVAFVGIVSFILGIVAENKKPATGIPMLGVGETICKFLTDPTVVLGSLSVVALVICTGLGFVSVFYPYKGQSVLKIPCCKALSWLSSSGLMSAFLCLNAMLFWLICQMLTHNAREDYLKEDNKGDYGQVLATTDYEAKV
ncbi:hypothetical protein MKX01_008120 [Papaver californicum]|nr:hypothetical protein MKX01_008120 [Papaver californicum]